MNPRELFMLGGRLLGLWILYQGISALTAYVLFVIGYRTDTTDVSKGYLIHACVELSLAYYLLLGTHHLARLVYGETVVINDKKPDDHPATLDIETP